MTKKLTAIILLIILLTSSAVTADADTKKEELKTFPKIDVIDLDWQLLEIEEDIQIYDVDVPLDDDITAYIVDQCINKGVDYKIFLALIEVESNYNHDLINYNKNGSYDSGLCQINSSNLGWLISEGHDISDIYGNIDAGIYILKLNLEKTGWGYARALTGYNTGRTDYINNYAKKVMEVKNENNIIMKGFGIN